MRTSDLQPFSLPELNLVLETHPLRVEEEVLLFLLFLLVIFFYCKFTHLFSRLFWKIRVSVVMSDVCLLRRPPSLLALTAGSLA